MQSIAIDHAVAETPVSFDSIHVHYRQLRCAIFARHTFPFNHCKVALQYSYRLCSIREWSPSRSPTALLVQLVQNTHADTCNAHVPSQRTPNLDNVLAAILHDNQDKSRSACAQEEI
jgi:hypothetical protein